MASSMALLEHRTSMGCTSTTVRWHSVISFMVSHLRVISIFKRYEVLGYITVFITHAELNEFSGGSRGATPPPSSPHTHTHTRPPLSTPPPPAPLQIYVTCFLVFIHSITLQFWSASKTSKHYIIFNFLLPPPPPPLLALRDSHNGFALVSDKPRSPFHQILVPPLWIRILNTCELIDKTRYSKLTNASYLCVRVFCFVRYKVHPSKQHN